MRVYLPTHLTDAALLDDVDTLAARERGATAVLVGHLAEVDRRGLFAPAYPSMHAYCLGRLRLSEDAAYRRIQAARSGREFPELLVELDEGRLNLSAVCLLAPHLTRENVCELVVAAAHKSNAEIRQWLVERFRPAPAAVSRQLEVRLPRLAVTQVECLSTSTPPVPAPPEQEPEAPWADSGPCAYEMSFTISPADHKRLQYAQALLSHAVPSGDVAEVYRRAIEMLIADREKRRFAVTPNPRAKRSPAQGRHVPARVRREVWKRDGGRCTFVAPSGHRCGTRALLEFDHISPVARGGLATEENLRLRCRIHNQDEANRVFGSKFMQEKRTRGYWHKGGRPDPFEGSDVATRQEDGGIRADPG